MIVDTRKLPEYRVSAPYERVLRVALDPRLGNYDKATVLSVTIEPGSTTGLHQHASDELIYIVSGRGRATIVEGNKVEEVDVEAGHLVVARTGVRHEMRNVGDTPLHLFCVFIPPLPAEGAFGEALKAAMKEARVT